MCVLKSEMCVLIIAGMCLLRKRKYAFYQIANMPLQKHTFHCAKSTFQHPDWEFPMGFQKANMLFKTQICFFTKTKYAFPKHTL